jgi:hypothetical protein
VALSRWSTNFSRQSVPAPRLAFDAAIKVVTMAAKK